MAGLESQIAEWRAFVAKAPAVDGPDVDELEAHLRDQIAELDAVGLTADEAFLVAVKRMGDVDTLSREFAREHRGRLWKQLVLGGQDEAGHASSGWLEALVFALAAAVTVQVARLAAHFPEEQAGWFLLNIGLFVLPFLAAYFAHRRRLDARRCVLTVAPFVLVALIVNLYPYATDSDTELLVALHLPIVLWAAVAYPYMGAVRSHERRMDFVRFTGEWCIYYALIALGGGVLLGLTALILEPIGPHVAERVVEWVLPSGAAGAVIVAAWLVESKQHVVENMAPVLTMLFTPLFALMLTIAAATYAVYEITGGAFDRDLLGVFDALLVVVLGLVLYAMSAREPSRPAGLRDGIGLLAVGSALVLDLMVLVAMLARIGDLGFTANRAAALSLNLVLLVNLAWTAWLSTRFLTRRGTFHRLERWQTSYLPVFALWGAAVIVILPPALRLHLTEPSSTTSMASTTRSGSDDASAIAAPSPMIKTRPRHKPVSTKAGQAVMGARCCRRVVMDER